MAQREPKESVFSGIETFHSAGRKVELTTYQQEDICTLLSDACDALKFSVAPGKSLTSYSLTLLEPFACFIPAENGKDMRGVGFDKGLVIIERVMDTSGETVSIHVPASGLEISLNPAGLWVAMPKDADKQPIMLSNKEMLTITETIARQSAPTIPGIGSWRDGEYPAADATKTTNAIIQMAALGSTNVEEERTYVDFNSSFIALPDIASEAPAQSDHGYTHRVMRVTETAQKTSISFSSMEPMLHLGEREYVKRQLFASSTLWKNGEQTRVTTADVVLTGTPPKTVLERFVVNEDDAQLYDGIQHGIGILVDNMTGQKVA